MESTPVFLDNFGLNLTAIAGVGAFVFFVTESLKKRFPMAGLGTQIVAFIVAAGLTYVVLQPVTGVQWVTAGVSTLIAWAAPDGIHQFAKQFKSPKP